MRITQYRHMTDDELLRFAESRAETTLEIELMNRLNAKLHGGIMQDFEKQRTLVFGESGK